MSSCPVAVVHGEFQQCSILPDVYVSDVGIAQVIHHIRWKGVGAGGVGYLHGGHNRPRKSTIHPVSCPRHALAVLRKFHLVEPDFDGSYKIILKLSCRSSRRTSNNQQTYNNWNQYFHL